MRFYNKGLAKTALLGLPFALAFTLSACDDSGSNADDNGGNGDASYAVNCDFKVEDNAWSFRYIGKDDEKESLTYAIVGDVVKRTRTIEGDEPCEVEDDFTSPNMTITCNGNVYTEVMEMPLGDASREDVFNTAKQECEFQKENQPDPHELVYNSDYRECQFSKEDDAWKILFATGYREYSDNGKWQRKDDNHWVLRTYFWEDGKIVKVTQENLELDDSEKPSAEKCQETLENKQREAAELGEVVAYYFEEGQTMLDQHCDEAKMVSTYTPDSQIKTKTKDEFFTYMFCDKY